MKARFLWLRWYWLWQFERGRTFFYDADHDVRFKQEYLWFRCPVFAIRVAFPYKVLS